MLPHRTRNGKSSTRTILGILSSLNSTYKVMRYPAGAHTDLCLAKGGKNNKSRANVNEPQRQLPRRIRAHEACKPASTGLDQRDHNSVTPDPTRKGPRRPDRHAGPLPPASSPATWNEVPVIPVAKTATSLALTTQEAPRSRPTQIDGRIQLKVVIAVAVDVVKSAVELVVVVVEIVAADPAVSISRW